jgi:hypothetical protein
MLLDSAVNSDWNVGGTHKGVVKWQLDRRAIYLRVHAELRAQGRP